MKRTAPFVIAGLLAAERIWQSLPVKTAIVAAIACGLIVFAEIALREIRRRNPAPLPEGPVPDTWQYADCNAFIPNGPGRAVCQLRQGHEGPHEATTLQWGGS